MSLVAQQSCAVSQHCCLKLRLRLICRTVLDKAIIGLDSLAAPIFDALGAHVGSVAITDSVQFGPEDPTREQVGHVLETAEKAPAKLGCHEP